MSLFERLAETKLREAQAAGLFDDLPGHGKPLELEDLSRVPEDLRASYCLLRGANVLPEELALRKEHLRLSDLLAACEDDDRRAALTARRDAALLRYRLLVEQRRASAGSQQVRREYGGALARRLGHR